MASIKLKALAATSSTAAAFAAYLYSSNTQKPPWYLAALRRTFSSSPPHLTTATMPSPEPKYGGTSAPIQPTNRLTGPYFPLSYKEGFSQWWASTPPAVAEAQVLAFLPFNTLPIPATSDCGNSANTAPTSAPPRNPDPYGPRECSSTLVPLSGKDRCINEFAVSRPADPHTQDLVILHGYGAGLGFFYRNYDPLSRRPGWKLWALDLLGMGRSSRPPFKIHAADKDGKIREAEDWFIDALEEWRIARGLDRFTLLGHSLGGYLATAYALKYPGRVKKLILASPVGIPRNPYAEQQPLPSNPPKDQSHPPPPTTTGMDADLLIDPSSPEPPSPDPPRRKMPGWVSYLWESNISPFSLVRWSGPLGPRLVSGWTSRRFSFLPEPESAALHTYAYSLFRQRGSGEYALAFLLAPGAYARHPLLERIGAVGVPTVLMYGEVDWMDVNGGFAARDKIRAEGVRRDREGWVGGGEWLGDGTGVGEDVGKLAGEVSEGERGGGEAKVLIVRGAGHHVYLDGWEEFNGMVGRELEDVEERERRRAAWGGETA